jgi:uncharacterized damage-inducible protein DinB
MSDTISIAALNELFDYNYWARDMQLQACAALTEEQFLRPVGGSFASIRDTLVHLLAVEWIWLERWRGASPRTLLSPEEFPSLAVVTERWKAVEGEMREYVRTLDAAALSWPATIVSTRGEPWTYPLGKMILHLLQHQNFHRGQVTTQLRLLGATPARVDFLLGLDVGFEVSENG